MWRWVMVSLALARVWGGTAWAADPGLAQMCDVAAPKHDAEGKVDPRFLEMHEGFLKR